LTCNIKQFSGNNKKLEVEVFDDARARRQVSYFEHEEERNSRHEEKRDVGLLESQSKDVQSGYLNSDEDEDQVWYAGRVARQSGQTDTMSEELLFLVSGTGNGNPKRDIPDYEGDNDMAPHFRGKRSGRLRRQVSYFEKVISLLIEYEPIICI
jgi:hypothetical protein